MSTTVDNRRAPRRTPAIWLAGADPRFISTTHDRARITSMGSVVGLIGLAAVISMTTALTILRPGPWAWLHHLPVGLLWGLIVLTIDRWITSTIDLDDGRGAPRRAAGRWVSGLGMFVGRFLMAGVVGLVIAEPLVLALFRPEVTEKVTELHQVRIAAETQRITREAKAKPDDPDSRVANAAKVNKTAQDRLAEARRQVDQRKQIYLCEYSATGAACARLVQQGLITGRAGNGTQTRQAFQTWQAAERELPAAQRDADTAAADLKRARTAQLRVKADIETQRKKDIEAMRAKVNADNGLLIQEQALSELTRHDGQLRLTRIFILLALMIVDLLPLLLKTLSPASQYVRNVQRSAAEAQAESDGDTTIAGYERDRRIQGAKDGINGRYDADAQLENHERALWVEWVKRKTEGRYTDDDELSTLERELWVQQEKEAIRRRYSTPQAAPGSADGGWDEPETVLAGPDFAAPREGRQAGSNGMLVGGRWQITRPLSGISHSTRFPPFLARDAYGHYRDDVVVKILAPAPGVADDERELHRALNEMAMPTGYIHQNLAEVLDSDIDPVHGCYVVTQYYPHTLEQWVSDSRHRPELTLGWALDITRQLAAGLAAAWGRGYVHLDVKPANIGLTNDGVVKLFDFGLQQNWRLEHGGHGTSDGPKFTPFYAPPEQLSRTDNWIQRAADVYALAATFYRLVTGRAPMQREALAAGLLDPDTWRLVSEKARLDLKDLVASVDPLPLDEFLPGLPPRVVAQIGRWLSRDRDTRNPGTPETFTNRVAAAIDEMVAAVEWEDQAEMPVGLEAVVEPTVAGPGDGGRSHPGYASTSDRANQAADAAEAPTVIPEPDEPSPPAPTEAQRVEDEPSGPFGDSATDISDDLGTAGPTKDEHR
jgi:serine/threonine protein kinase